MDCRTGGRVTAGLTTASIFFCSVRSPGLSRLYHSVAAELPRFLSSRDRRPAMVYRRPQLRVASRRLHMLVLCGHSRDVPLMFRRFLLRRWTCVNSPVAPVVTYSIDRGVVDHGLVVNIVNIGDVYIHHGTVIEEVSIVPTAAGKAHAEVTESIVDPAIKPYGRPPIPRVEEECIAAPTPPAWGPEETNLGSQHPRARYPVVIGSVVIPIPIPRRPEITVAGADRLLIHRQCRWANSDRYPELSE